VERNRACVAGLGIVNLHGWRVLHGDMDGSKKAERLPVIVRALMVDKLCFFIAKCTSSPVTD
jgi:hypothetical protein